VRPFLRWAGSKRQLLSSIRPYWKDGCSRYIEPFAGSSCLFFELQPSNAILGDLNWELIATYRAIKHDPDLVLECLRRLARGKRAYYLIRAIDPRPLADAELAARFIYLNHYCFNGLFRTNRSGNFNVPYGRQKKPVPFDENLILDASRALKSVTLLAADFEETIARAQPGEFVYIDPPYAVSSRREFSEYLPESFSDRDLGRLRTSLEWLDTKGIGFVATYADSREARSLLAPWKPRRIWTRRNIAGFAAHRRGAYEILATNLSHPGEKK
jgi:DNA adenine methylase